MRYVRSRMYRCAKFKSSSLSVAGFMADELAATLPLSAPSDQDALCTRPIGLAQPAAEVTFHLFEKLIDARPRGLHPGLGQRRRQGFARSDRDRALSEPRVGRARQRALSHGLVIIAHAARVGDVRLGTGYIRRVLNDDTTGVA